MSQNLNALSVATPSAELDSISQPVPSTPRKLTSPSIPLMPMLTSPTIPRAILRATSPTRRLMTPPATPASTIVTRTDAIATQSTPSGASGPSLSVPNAPKKLAHSTRSYAFGDHTPIPFIIDTSSESTQSTTSAPQDSATYPVSSPGAQVFLATSRAPEIPANGTTPRLSPMSSIASSGGDTMLLTMTMHSSDSYAAALVDSAERDLEAEADNTGGDAAPAFASSSNVPPPISTPSAQQSGASSNSGAHLVAAAAAAAAPTIAPPPIFTPTLHQPGVASSNPATQPASAATAAAQPALPTIVPPLSLLPPFVLPPPPPPPAPPAAGAGAAAPAQPLHRPLAIADLSFRGKTHLLTNIHSKSSLRRKFEKARLCRKIPLSDLEDDEDYTEDAYTMYVLEAAQRIFVKQAWGMSPEERHIVKKIMLGELFVFYEGGCGGRGFADRDVPLKKSLGRADPVFVLVKERVAERERMRMEMMDVDEEEEVQALLLLETRDLGSEDDLRAADSQSRSSTLTTTATQTQTQTMASATSSFPPSSPVPPLSPPPTIPQAQASDPVEDTGVFVPQNSLLNAALIGEQIKKDNDGATQGLPSPPEADDTQTQTQSQDESQQPNDLERSSAPSPSQEPETEVAPPSQVPEDVQLCVTANSTTTTSPAPTTETVQPVVAPPTPPTSAPSSPCSASRKRKVDDLVEESSPSEETREEETREAKKSRQSSPVADASLGVEVPEVALPTTIAVAGSQPGPSPAPLASPSASAVDPRIEDQPQLSTPAAVEPESRKRKRDEEEDDLSPTFAAAQVPSSVPASGSVTSSSDDSDAKRVVKRRRVSKRAAAPREEGDEDNKRVLRPRNEKGAVAGRKRR